MNELAGYVTDVPYVYGFKPMLAPAWLDLVAIIGGVTPPARDTRLCLVRSRLRPRGDRGNPRRDPSDGGVPRH